MFYILPLLNVILEHFYNLNYFCFDIPAETYIKKQMKNITEFGKNYVDKIINNECLVLIFQYMKDER